MLQSFCRLCWDRLPLPVSLKRRARNLLFRVFPGLFRGLPAYQRWRLFQPEGHLAGTAEGQELPAADPALAGTVRAIAMYLPQFHRIPENDLWWGEGFTEWTNVRRGKPMYAGHHQPRVPHADLGYYDLDEPRVLERQAAMARRYGINGFCFYYYWFNGRRLLEKPLERMLASGRPDFPFCICWANENWTRNWDGLDREVLIASSQDPDADRRFILDVLPFLRDPRAIRVEGRPLLLVYHASGLTDPARTAAVWRDVCRAEGLGEIHLASVWSRDRTDPRHCGFDSAVQFPPLLVPCENLALGSDACPPTAPGFRGAILDYRAAVRAGLGPLPEGFSVFRGVMPSWDNTARRMDRGTSWINASPEAYAAWLEAAVARTCREQPPGRRLVFINAWNEWAEGAHLEPDTRLGYRSLEATQAALAGSRRGPVPRGQEQQDAGTWLRPGSAAFRSRLAATDHPVLVDLLFCQPGFHGGGEYGKAVFRALVHRTLETGTGRVWAAFDPDTFMEPWIWKLCRDADVPVVAVKSPSEIAAVVDAGGFETFFTPGLVTYADQFHGSTRGPARTRLIGTVHDILDVTLAEQPADSAGSAAFRPRRSRADYARLIASERIDTIVTVSEHSRTEILREFGPPRPRLVVLAPPGKQRPEPVPCTVAGRPISGLDYALVVNAGRPEKNAAAAVRAFDAVLGDPAASADVAGLHLVVAGVDSLAELASVRHPERFLAVPQLPPAEYEFLLAHARLLVYPSFGEGFGYPPVEALRFARPSVVADTGALREVCGDAALYCDPRSVASIGDAILRLLREPIPGDVLESRLRTIAARQREDLAALVDLLLTSTTPANRH
jgi:glycosyltransferase involved in cell wall biosynthesis